MLPPFDSKGNLPPGIHRATLDEIEARFGGSSRRRWLFDGVRRAIADLRNAGCKAVWLNGSFVTSKDEPADFDMCYDFESVDLSRLDPSLRSIGDRQEMKTKYGGDILPTSEALPFLEFFQQDRDGDSKGIVEIDVGSIP